MYFLPCQKKIYGSIGSESGFGYTSIMCYIGKLYKVESEADETGLTIEERKERRICKSYLVILKFEK